MTEENEWGEINLPRSDLVRKLEAACAFGTPNSIVTAEIIGEVHALELEVQNLRQRLTDWHKLWMDLTLGREASSQDEAKAADPAQGQIGRKELAPGPEQPELGPELEPGFPHGLWSNIDEDGVAMGEVKGLRVTPNQGQIGNEPCG